MPGKMEAKSLENLRRSWQEAYGGENKYKTAILDSGVTYTKIGATPNEGQFLETRREQRIDIASVFQVPPHMIGEVEKTKSNVEQSSIEFVTYTLGPWIAAWENELKRKLFHTVGRSAGKNFARFDTRRLLYPDSAARSEFYRTGKNWGYLSSNDIRELEDMNPIEAGSADDYWMPLNMGPAETVEASPEPTLGKKVDGNESAPAPAPEPKPVVQEPEQKNIERYVKRLTPIFRDACGRFCARHKRDLDNCRRIFTPVMEVLAEVLEVNASGHTIPRYIDRLVVRATAWEEGKLEQFAVQETRKAIMELMGMYIPDRPLYGMRHGTTPYNEEDRYREWTTVDLDNKGRAMVEQAANQLKDKGIRRLIASPLQRSKTSAAIVSRVLGGIAIEYETDLNTWKHGFGGKTKTEAAEKIKYYLEHPDEIPPNGESLSAFRERNQRVIDRIQEQNPLTGPALFMTSGSNLGSWNNKAEAIAEALTNHCMVGPAGIVELKSDGSLSLVFSGDQTSKQAS